MTHLLAIDLSLPLESWVLKFLIFLVIILLAPIMLNKIRIPQLLGFIIAGALIGPFGFNLMERDSSMIMLGTVGLLYIMFLAGLEIDIADFKKNSWRSLVFGLYTFLIPMGLGMVAGLYVLNFSMLTSVLLASMFASHTLITYPIISRLGISKNPAVTITAGGTMITDTLALLVLAVIVGLSAGDVDSQFWTRLGVSFVVFTAVIAFLFPIIGRWFFKRYNDNVAQYIFVLAMMFLGAYLAEIAGIEAIIGAFMAGLAMNRLIPRTSALMNRIDFVGNAIFIPFFLIGVGMLIDFRAFFKDFETIKVAAVMTIVALVAKFLAAYATQKTFGYSLDQRRLIFGLSNSQAAATLAAVTVGYNIILGYTDAGDPIRLLNESVLNGTILMILITCTVSSFVTQKGAQNIALAAEEEGGDKSENEEGKTERILIPFSQPETVEELVCLGITIQSPAQRNYLYGLKIISNNSSTKESDKKAEKMLEQAVKAAAATDNDLEQLIRYDSNFANAVISTIHEKKITDLILELPYTPNVTEPVVPNQTLRDVLTQDDTTTMIYKPVQPLATAKRIVVVVPERAEKEMGFALWMRKIWNIGKNTNTKVIFFGSENTLEHIRAIHATNPIEAGFHEFDDWDDFLILFREIQPNDLLFAVMSRKGWPSYHRNMVNIPGYLNKYLQSNGFILIYPMQMGAADLLNNEANNPSLLIS